jgi:hypothetical protein
MNWIHYIENGGVVFPLSILANDGDKLSLVKYNDM